MSHGARPLRNAAAEARLILVEAASRQLGVPVERLTVADGVVTARDDPTKSVGYGALIGGKHFNARV
ncbi:MAG: isoquinoline 1-oxidoreductase, partial [Candidatus Rokuibacteriota bacterium]